MSLLCGAAIGKTCKKHTVICQRLAATQTIVPLLIYVSLLNMTLYITKKHAEAKHLEDTVTIFQNKERKKAEFSHWKLNTVKYLFVAPRCLISREINDNQ